MGTIVAFEQEGAQEKKNFLYSKFVTPFLSYLKWTLCTPFHINLEETSGLYFCKEASLLYKIPAIFWQFLQFLYIFWGSILSPVYGADVLDSAKFLHRITYVSYTLYQVIWLNVMWKKFAKIPQLLDQGNIIYQGLLRESQLSSESRVCFKQCLRVSCIRGTSFIILGLLSISSTFSLVYTLITINSSKDNSHTSTYAYVDNFVNKTMSSLCQVSVYMMAGWALYFRKLLSLIVKQINSAAAFDEIFSATKLFAQLCLLVDEFNAVFGYLLLITLLDSILYKTITFAILFGGYSPGVDSSVLYLIACIFPSIIMLYFMADVHKLGSTVPNILKRKYLVENSASESDPLTVGDVHLSLLAHNDVLSNGIGFKGAGFFTISYAFVGSVIGITVTYTVVILEFTNNSEFLNNSSS